MDRRFHLQSHVSYLYANKPRQLAFEAASATEFAAWRQTLRATILDLLGISGRALPSNLSAEWLQAIDRGRYVEEKYALDVGENIPAPMYILIPKTEPPYRAVMVFHGHNPSVQYILGNYPDGETAQNHLALDDNYAQVLAEAGYLVCAVEQRGFGERISDQVQPSDYHNSCRHLSFEYLMQGRTMIGERCWDGMVAMSYVQSRDDVVKGIFGCTGHSGGGTTTLWLSALDDRISVVVPSCYFCSFKHSILSMVHCECNYVPGVLQYVEMGELAAMIAPRPLRVIAGEHDPIYPVEGTRQQFETVRRAYELLGAADRISLAIHPGEHAYHHGFSREWFDRWLREMSSPASP